MVHESDLAESRTGTGYMLTYRLTSTWLPKTLTFEEGAMKRYEMLSVNLQSFLIIQVQKKLSQRAKDGSWGSRGSRGTDIFEIVAHAKKG